MRARRLENDFTETATVCRAAAHRDLSDAVSVSASFHASFELQCLCPLKHVCPGQRVGEQWAPLTVTTNLKLRLLRKSVSTSASQQPRYWLDKIKIS